MKNKITDDIYYVGESDRNLDLFESHFVVPNGMAYNSYVIKDEKTAVMDAVDKQVGDKWIKNLEGFNPDYLIIQHVEPDHTSHISTFLEKFPDAKIYASAMSIKFLKQFYDMNLNAVAIKEGDTLNLGKHTLHFIAAPMIHWPEVMMTYDDYDKVLFSADGFGKFGAYDTDEEWACEARRYYFGIVGKYGMQVQNVLKKASELDIEKICPLHGPVLTENLGYYIDLYDKWSSYKPESEGICINYTSVWGNTKKAVELLAKKLSDKGCPKVVVNDLAREDMAECVEDAFRYGTIVFATTTYNMHMFPYMRDFLADLSERNFQNRKVALIENGTWTPAAGKLMREKLENCKNIEIVEPVVTIRSALNEESLAQLNQLADNLL